MNRRLVVLQGGGPTAVINATLAGVLRVESVFGEVFGLAHSFEGDADASLLNLTPFRDPDRNRQLAATPGALLGSSRKKVTEADFERILLQLEKVKADALIGIGGNGTMTALQLFADYASAQGRDVEICGAPKTVDNDLPGLHVSPGYGSAARFVAMAVRDFGYDFRAMSTFDDVTILETMGRDTGWLAAASTLLKDQEDDPPHIVLVPERAVDEQALLDDISRQHAARGHVFIVVNEMLRTEQGDLLGESFQNGPTDALGRRLYSLSLGTGNYLADLIYRNLKLQTRCLRPGNLGRAFSCCVSEPDHKLALDTGAAAVKMMAAGNAHGRMVAIDENLSCHSQALQDSVGVQPLPESFVAECADGGSVKFKHYALPLIGQISPLAKYPSRTSA